MMAMEFHASTMLTGTNMSKGAAGQWQPYAILEEDIEEDPELFAKVTRCNISTPPPTSTPPPVPTPRSHLNGQTILMDPSLSSSSPSPSVDHVCDTPHWRDMRRLSDTSTSSMASSDTYSIVSTPGYCQCPQCVQGVSSHGHFWFSAPTVVTPATTTAQTTPSTTPPPSPPSSSAGHMLPESMLYEVENYAGCPCFYSYQTMPSAPTSQATTPAAPSPTQILVTVTKTENNQKIGCWIRGNAVTNVEPSRPAAIAGLVVGMRVMQVDGTPIDPASVSALIRRKWRENGQVKLLMETQVPVSKSRRSRAKARARARAQKAALAADDDLVEMEEEAEEMEEDDTDPIEA